MSRSFKKPVVTCSNQIDKDKAHRALRRMVKSELDKPEPDLTKLDMDTRDMGDEQWGTKFGYIYVDPDDVKAQEEKKKLERK